MTSDRWVTFDCFGTLVDWHSGYRRILSPIAGDRTDALIRAYHDFERAIEAERPHRLYKDVLTAGLEQAAGKIGLALPKGEADVIVRRWGEQPFYGDVGAALGALRAAGWKLAMLTNCDNDLFAETLAKFPVKPDLVVTAEMVGSYKPELGHFRRFQQESGVERRNWIHAACSWFHDIAPARRMGVKRIWVDRDKTGHDPAAATRVLPDVTSLAKTVAELRDMPAPEPQA
ncbi:MAG TPA: HAD family hydrolase [Stellaceae bacterium]|nr:HAD family hydrolase [Stellaceae bacterium]